MLDLEILSVVALLEDIPEKSLRKGQVGTVVLRLGDGMYEIEFSDDQGQTYASAALGSDKLLQLHHEPTHQAA
jgi:hypothetical protein